MDATQKTEDNAQPVIDTKTEDNAQPVIDTKTEDNTFIKDLFNNSNMNAIFWFLAIYFIIIIILAIFFKEQLVSMQEFSGQIIDILVFGTGIYYAFYAYYTKRDGENVDVMTYLKDELRRELNDFNTVLNLGMFLIVLFGMTYAYRMLTMSSDAPFSLNLLSSLGWIYMCILLIVNFFKYVLNISILDTIFPQIVTHKVETDEVFNVSNNLYTYDNAQEVCSSLDSRLATYDEIEKAYNNGAEWCNYGWSEGQMAFFPTQKDTWSVLQKNKEHANDCGRPGVNGGFMMNPYVKFGVNCFGKKPKQSETDILRMTAKKTALSPALKEHEALKQEWKDITLNSFNKDKWSSY